MEGWEINLGGDVIQLSNEKCKANDFSSSFPCVELDCISQATGTITGTIDISEIKGVRNKFTPGQILYGKLRPYLNKYARPEFDGACSTEIWVLDTKDKNKLINDYLFYLVQSKDFRIAACTMAGTKMPRASWDVIENTNFLLPPLAEQERIVEILSEADAAITAAETLLQSKNNELKALQQKLFAPIYSGRNHRLDEFLSLRNERIIPHDDIPLFSLTIEEGVCPKSERYDREHLVSDTSAKKYKVVYPDDIVFNPQNVRWGAIARSYQSAPVCLSPIYEVMHVIEERGDPDFFDHFLTCDRQVAYYAANTEGSLIERMTFKADAMMSLKFNIPSIEEQRNIAQALECYRAHIGHQNSLVTALKKQKRGLVQQLLTGKLRVSEKVQ